MPQQLNSEGHDESQYLPKKWLNPRTGKEEDYPVVNPWRAGKGDIKRNEDDKLESMTWLPDVLFERKHIQQQHLNTAKSFFRILVQAKKALGICDLRGQLFDRYPAGISDDIDMFIQINRRLVKPESNILIWLVWDDYNRGNVALAMRVIGTILHALENAQEVIDYYAQLSNNKSSASPFLHPKFP